MQDVFAQLRQTLLANAPDMVIAGDKPGELLLNTPWNNPQKPMDVMWFGGVMLKKSYVSVHLMPVYTEPELAAAIPDILRTRMQGKSCFNFKRLDADQAEALTALTTACAKAYAERFGA